MSEDLTKEQFVERFVAEMLRIAFGLGFGEISDMTTDLLKRLEAG